MVHYFRKSKKVNMNFFPISAAETELQTNGLKALKILCLSRGSKNSTILMETKDKRVHIVNVS